MFTFLKNISIKVKILIIVFVLIMPIVIWGITELASYYKLIYNNKSTWIGFFGGYVGSILGGFITLLVMDETIKNGDKNLEKNINENKILQKRNERVAFCNDLASIISNYCSEIDKFIKFTTLAKNAKLDLENHQKYLEKATNIKNLEKLKLNEGIKNGKIPVESINPTLEGILDIEKVVDDFKSRYNDSSLELKTNLEKANNIDISSLYFLLKIKLKDINEAKKLLKLISEIYSCYDKYIDSSNLDSLQLSHKNVNELLFETTYFINSYITKL